MICWCWSQNILPTMSFHGGRLVFFSAPHFSAVHNWIYAATNLILEKVVTPRRLPHSTAYLVVGRWLLRRLWCCLYSSTAMCRPCRRTSIDSCRSFTGTEYRFNWHGGGPTNNILCILFTVHFIEFTIVTWCCSSCTTFTARLLVTEEGGTTIYSPWISWRA